MPEKFEQTKKPAQPDILESIQSWALKTELDNKQRNYLDQLVAQLNLVLDNRSVKQMVEQQDVAGLEKYLALITRIKKLLKDKEMVLEGVELEKAKWEDFYREVFNLEVDFTNLLVPKEKEGFDRLLIMAKGINLDKLYEVSLQVFGGMQKPTMKNLAEIVFSAKSSELGAYAIWLRDDQEPDVQFTHESASNLNEKKFQYITLEERLLLDLKYFNENHEHLDVMNPTLCAGSRTVDGKVPVVGLVGGTGNPKIVWVEEFDSQTAAVAREIIT